MKNIRQKKVSAIPMELFTAEQNQYTTNTPKWSLFILLSLVSLTLLSNNPKQKDTTHWRNPRAEIKQIFVSNNKLKNPEVLKLYDNYTYEFLVYQRARKKSEMKRETGTYSLKNKTLNLVRDGKPKVYSPRYKNSYYFSPEGTLYANLWDKFFNKKEALLFATNDDKYHLPFYIDPDAQTIVTNKESVSKIVLGDLVFHLTKKAKTEQEKVNILVNFINTSVDYDYKSARNHQALLKGKSNIAILAGRDRTGVCSDYASITRELITLAHVDVKVIHGYARTNLSDIQLYLPGPHAWNKITIDGSEKLYDVCWAEVGGDNWLDVNPAVMIHTHFPDSKEDQLLENPLTANEFNHQPYITGANNVETKEYWPKDAIHYCENEFVFTYNEIVKDVSVSSIDTNIFELIYDEEGGRSKSYPLKNVDGISVSYVNGKTIVKIPITKRCNAIEVDVDGKSIGYKVIRSTKAEDYTFTMNMVKRNYIDNYMRAVFSAVYLNDIPKLKELVGDTNSVFFNKKGKLTLNKELLEKFKTWDGLISTLTVNYLENRTEEGVKYTTTRRSIELFNKEFEVQLEENGYRIVAMR